MKVIINSHELKEAFNKILTVVDKRNSRPILTNCLVEVEKNKLTLIATDLEVSAKVVLKANTNDMGRVCLNIKNIFDILRELPDENLELEIDEVKNYLNLKCKNIDYSLLITSAEEFPLVSFEKTGTSFSLNSSEILKIINKTSYAISTDETRINLNGIYLQQLEGKLRSVAIDGHRLALFDVGNFSGNSTYLQNGVIVPKKGISELKKICDIYPEHEVKITVDDSFINMSFGEEYYLSTRLIAREYPKYQTVIPNKTIHQLKVDRNLILTAVKRIRLLSNEKTNGVKLDIKKNTLTISANHPALGHAKEIVEVNYSGVDIEIGFNAKYMIDSFSVLDESEIIMEFNNELSPVIIRSENIPNYLGIIMPLKL